MNRKYLIITLLAFGAASASAQTMDWLCHPGVYSRIQYVGGDLFKVRNAQGKWGIVNAMGDVKVPADFDSITSIRENRALILDKSGKRLLRIVDGDGDPVKDFSNEEVYVSRYPYFKEGRLAFARRDGLYGYMNELGVTVIEPQFYMAAPFQDGIAAVQYEGTDFGLINKGGRSAIVTDEIYPFISSPVNGRVLAIGPSRKGGDQLVVRRIDGTDLKKEKVLEDGMNIWLSDDFTSIECQLGHTYTLDNQWRVVSSGHNAKLPKIPDETSDIVTESSIVLSKVATEGGVKITYLGSPIIDYAFPDVEIYDKTYAIVTSKDGKVGVLKLHPSAAITVRSPEVPVVISHGGMQDVVLDVELVDVDPSKIKWYRNDQGSLTQSTLENVNGLWKLRMPYFKAADAYGEEVAESVDIAITYDGFDWMHQLVEIRSMHQAGYEVDLVGSDTANANGNAQLTLHVKAIDGSENAVGSVIVDGGRPVAINKGKASIPINVSVPAGATKTFTYTVVVKSEGCPDFTAKVSKTVSNPVRKASTPQKPKKKEPEKKEIIII